MRYISKWRAVVSGASLSAVALVAATSGVVSAAPALVQGDQSAGTHPTLSNFVSGKQDKPAVAPGFWRCRSFPKYTSKSACPKLLPNL